MEKFCFFLEFKTERFINKLLFSSKMKRELYEELNPQLEADLRKIENPELIGELAGSDAETVFDNPGLHVDIRKTYSPSY